MSGRGKHARREFVEASGDLTEAEFIEFQIASTTALTRCCADGALLYLFMDWRHQWEMLSGIRAAGLTLINMAVWVKRQGGMGSLYRSQYELCYVAKKGSEPHRNNVQLGRFGRNRTNCWFYPGVNSFGSSTSSIATSTAISPRWTPTCPSARSCPARSSALPTRWRSP